MRYIVPVSPHRQFAWFLICVTAGLGLSELAYVGVVLQRVPWTGWPALCAVGAVFFALLALRAMRNWLRMVAAKFRLMFGR